MKQASDKHFRCTICQRGFTRIDHLKRHHLRRAYHSELKLPTSPPDSPLHGFVQKRGEKGSLWPVPNFYIVALVTSIGFLLTEWRCEQTPDSNPTRASSVTSPLRGATICVTITLTAASAEIVASLRLAREGDGDMPANR
ncbi:hypothetical protein Egran_04813 [Elaphomyces granulatus]|uniref:C2H2-type domain-containing protein n=1 Tax=Elaphomyces granulatus TaxID=519963 RepID=A0A232LTS3_9EURO|nr:hypothetical protein Egran_04813 [Elaphomyces granulatus]